MEVNNLHVGTQIQVTAGVFGQVDALSNLAHQSATQASTIPGTIWADGGLHIGAPLFAPGETLVGFARAPGTNPKALANLSILKVSSRPVAGGQVVPPTPIDVMFGDPTGPVGITCHTLMINIVASTAINIVSPVTNHLGLFKATGMSIVEGAELHKAIRSIIGKEVKTGSMVSNGAKAQNGILKNLGAIFNPVSSTPVVKGYATGNKSFDIPHAVKENKRIRHICAEGPEAGIYIRGKLEGSNVIELPEYWQGLVDYDTITVSLTPFGKPDKSLYVKNITEDKVIVSSDHLTQVKCFYEIWVARHINPNNLDEKLHVVYDGDSPADYPGNNKNYIIGGYQ